MAADPPPLVQMELPPSVTVGPGEGGLPRLRVSTRAASAEVYLHGAHVTSWTPAGQAPVLWTSAASVYAAESAIRGGVPICWPWFGGGPDDDRTPPHGFARLHDWSLVEAEESGDLVTLTLGLVDSEASRALWPYPFELRYAVGVGETLTLALTVRNTGDEAITFEEALHTYYAVHDVRSVVVSGLESARYQDRLGGPDPVGPTGGPVRFAGETDRIYLDTEDPVTVHDAARRVRLDKRNSRNTVVWNPWVAKAAAMPDFGDDEWPAMVCVETCNVRGASVRLDPGHTHTMTATTTLGPAGGDLRG